MYYNLKESGRRIQNLRKQKGLTQQGRKRCRYGNGGYRQKYG